MENKVSSPEAYSVEEKNDKDIELLRNKTDRLEVLVTRLSSRITLLEVERSMV